MPLLDKLLVLAMAAQAFLALGLVFWLGFERVPRVTRGEMRDRGTLIRCSLKIVNAGLPCMSTSSVACAICPTLRIAA